MSKDKDDERPRCTSGERDKRQSEKRETQRMTSRVPRIFDLPAVPQLTYGR